MSHPPQPRDIVRLLGSVDRTLYTFYDNSNLSTTSGITKTKRLSTLTPDVSSPPHPNKPKSAPARPGVVLDVSSDYATVAMFTTLQGKAPSDIKGLLRPIIAAILPVNDKHDAAASGGLPTFAVHPTWHVSGAAKPSLCQLCLCLKHRIPINELELWKHRGGPGERFKMLKADFKLLQRLCERNEHLRGLFASEIRWLFEELSLDDFVKRPS